MAAVSQKTLDWLYRVISSNSHDPNQAYLDPNRTYNDVAQLLSQYPNFSPRTDVYTYENGASALLLHISGTLLVNFRGAVYRFPIALWVPNTYPDMSPIVYVTPTQDMMVRPGQHVSGDGKVYHHYLAHWREARDRSNIVDFLFILRDVFAKEPPVISKQNQNIQPLPPRSQQHQRQLATPPTVPPLPPELATNEPSPVPTPAPQATQNPPPVPPQLPPKPEAIKPPESRQPVQAEKYNKPPPLPPLPAELAQPQTDSRLPNGRGEQYLPKRSSSLRTQVTPLPHPLPQGQKYQGHTQAYQGRGVRPPQMDPGATQQQPQYQPQPPLSALHPNAAQPPPLPPSSTHPQYHTSQRPIPSTHQVPPIQQPVPQKKPAPDLLTSPFELELPVQESVSTPPPIPPNPQKDVILQTLSHTLTQTLHSNIDQINSGIQPLHSQSNALHAAVTTLQSEISALNNFHADIQSNTAILQQSLHRADAVIADAKGRLSSSSSSSSSAAGRTPPGLPPIDEVLVAPTVVGKQIYDLVTDERGIERAIYALQSGLVKGRVGFDTWTKLTRGLAREAFLKKALIRKAAKGMGLAVEGGT